MNNSERKLIMINLLYKSCIALTICGWIAVMLGIFLGDKVTYIGVGMTVTPVIILMVIGIINKFSAIHSLLK